MAGKTPTRNSFNPKALAGFLVSCAVLAGLIALHMRWIGTALAVIYLALLITSSLVVIVRALSGSHNPGKAHLGQLAALPPKWRKWVLGEEDEKAP